MDILIGKWIAHFNYEDKNAKIKAENTAGEVPPARLSNAVPTLCRDWQ